MPLAAVPARHALGGEIANLGEAAADVAIASIHNDRANPAVDAGNIRPCLLPVGIIQRDAAHRYRAHEAQGDAAEDVGCRIWAHEDLAANRRSVR